MSLTSTPVLPIEILLAEDNPGDVRLTREALKRGKFQVNLNVTQDGEAALAYLRKEGKYGEATTPSLVLLDLNMPRKDGRQVLSEMKRDPNLKYIPVIVFSSSESEQDISTTYKLQANCYVSKPFDASKFEQVMHSIEEFWLSIAKLPTATGK